jgi:predicted nucleotidyltransferase component of viral defense system
MKKVIKNKTASIRARLMNIARAEKIDFDSLLLRYFQERLLYRLSISDFSDRFVLKGGLLLICLKMPKCRPTKDIDFLAEQIKNDINEIENIFKRISEIQCDDGVKFISSSIVSERITEDADYEGIRLKIDGTLGQARKRLQVDIGFGDIIIPEATSVEFPSLLEDPPKVKAYSVESIISEKFEAMVKLAMANSRMKDFYDVYFLSSSHNFKGNELKKAIETTFQRRKTPMPDNPLIFRPEFHRDKERQKMWTAFLRKSRLHDVNQEFSEVMHRITVFLEPVVRLINEKSEITKSWIARKGIWE